MHKDQKNYCAAADLAAVEVRGDAMVLSGQWCWACIDEAIITKLAKSALSNVKAINAENITGLDTIGAFFIVKLLQLFEQMPSVKLQAVHQVLYNSVLENTSFDSQEQKSGFSTFNTAYRLGSHTFRYAKDLINFTGFIGEVTETSAKMALLPWQIRIRLILDIIYSAGFQAVGIVCLLAFLIGVVLAYQIGGQLQTYGANIFVVNILGISLLREFAPLITSIIVAGRSGSAFAAEIGTMKVQEELDALRTFGISPIGRLVLPRLAGLLVALPILVILADIASVAGGMVMSKAFLGLGYVEFLQQFGSSVSFKTYVLGLVKTPVFALIIATIGCYLGLSVKRDSASIGEQTTKSVVYAIFLIIIADAAFSILFSAAGL